MTELRAHLREYIEKARAGEDVVVTERGTPVARLVTVDKEAEILARLVREGVLDPPTAPKPLRTEAELIPAHGSVSDFITEMRR